jgi:hypothetical protein
MAVAPKKLKVGDLVDVDGRMYDVVPDKPGGVTLGRRSPCSPTSCASGMAHDR